MNEQERPFDMVAIVFLMLIALLSDASDVATLLAFPVPVVGQVAYLANAFLVSPVVWAIIQGWFIMKLGFFGKAGIFNVAGGVANLIGIPATTITTGIAIWVANHPKLAAVATTVAAGAATGGASAAAGAGAAAKGAAGAAKGVATETAGAARTAATSEASTAEKAATESKATKTEMKTGAREPEKPLGEPPTPFEELQKLAEEPLPEEESEEEEYA